MTRNRKIVYISFAVVLIVFSGVFLLRFTVSDADKENIRSDFSELSGFKAVSPPIPRKLDFAGESVPLNLFYVREALDRELSVNTYWHSQSLLLFKRANRHLPVVESILKKHQIPDDFKYVVLVESGFQHAVSSAGAAGYWQFMKETALEYGLEVTDQVDERYHLVKATEATCKYLLKSHEKYGSWTLVAAAFNGGQGRMDKLVKRQKTNNYYEMFMNQETSRYVFRILALKLIFEHPEKYGYQLKREDLYPSIPQKRFTVTESIPNLVEFAREKNVSYRMLRELNPWLADTFLPVKPGKSYHLVLPTGKFDDYDALIRDEVNGITPSQTETEREKD